MSHRLEFFFDCSSPWTYLAFESVLREIAPLSAEIVWRPILVGGIFNTGWRYCDPPLFCSSSSPTSRAGATVPTGTLPLSA